MSATQEEQRAMSPIPPSHFRVFVGKPNSNITEISAASGHSSGLHIAQTRNLDARVKKVLAQQGPLGPTPFSRGDLCGLIRILDAVEPEFRTRSVRLCSKVRGIVKRSQSVQLISTFHCDTVDVS